MSDWKLYEKLFDIAGLPDDSNPGAVAIQNHLCQLLINRINGDMNLKNTTVLEESWTDSWFNVEDRTEFPISQSFCAKHKDWSWARLDLSSECSLDSWNQSSGFTWNISDLYMIGYAMHICYCDIECLTAEDIREAFSFYVESFCCEIQEGEIESIDSDEVDSIIQLHQDILQAIETGRTENLYLQKMAEDFSKLIFYDYVSVENVLRNFNNILQVCFGICDGTDRALLVLSNNRIPSYFKIRDTLDKATRTLLDSAIECISNPLINGFLDIEPFSCQDDSHYSVIIPVGDFKGCEVTEHHFRPFYYEAACAISDYFSDKECILDENK